MSETTNDTVRLKTNPQELRDIILRNLLVTERGGVAQASKELFSSVSHLLAPGKVLILRGEGNSYRMIKSRDTDLARVTDLAVVHLCPGKTEPYLVLGDRSLVTSAGPKLSEILRNIRNSGNTETGDDSTPTQPLFQAIDFVSDLAALAPRHVTARRTPDFELETFKSSLIIERDMDGAACRFLLYPESLAEYTTSPNRMLHEHVFAGQLEAVPGMRHQRPHMRSQLVDLAVQTLLNSRGEATGLHFTLVDPRQWASCTKAPNPVRTVEKAEREFRNSLISSARSHTGGDVGNDDALRILLSEAMTSDHWVEYVFEHLHFMSREDFFKTKEGQLVTDHLEGDGDRSRYSTSQATPGDA